MSSGNGGQKCWWWRCRLSAEGQQKGQSVCVPMVPKGERADVHQHQSEDRESYPGVTPEN